MSKFILIDNSIRSFAGHHCEYALCVLDAAARCGYSPILVVNRDISREMLTEMPYPVLPAYRYDFWGVSRTLVTAYDARRRWSRLVGGLTTRWRVRLVFSWAGFLWALATQVGQELSTGTPGTRSWLRSGILVQYCAGVAAWTARRIVKLARLLRRTAPARVVASGARRAIRTLRAAAARTRRTAGRLIWQWRVRCFTADTATATRKIGLEEGDLVFLPTVSEADLLGLGIYLRRHPGAARVTWHLLFRRDIYRGDETRYAEQEASLASLRGSFRAFRDKVGHLAVHFYTDTERLTAQYNRLGVFRFSTLPIPVSPHLCRPAAAGDGAIRVTYAGDARTEKGYHLLPDLVRDVELLRPPDARVRYVFQSNFTFRIPEQQAPVIVARRSLQSFPAQMVQIIPDALTPEEYRNLVLSAGIMLLLYDRENYYARSSGLLAEALSAGIPVLAPAASWLSDQFEPAVLDYHLGLKAHLPSWMPRPGVDLSWSNPSGTERDKWTLPLRAVLSPPRGTGYLLVTFRPTLSPSPGGPAHVLVSVRSEGLAHSEMRCLVRLREDGRVSTGLFPLVRPLSPVVLELSDGLAERHLAVADLEVTALMAEPGSQPLGAVGCAFADTSQAAFLLGDMIRHHAHYRKTAAAFARQWVGVHCPDRLVAGLTAAGGHRR